MCGIVGWWNLKNREPIDLPGLDRMIDSLTHRGPDDRGVYVDPVSALAFGFRRLSIIDLSLNAHQPMCNEDGTIWIVFNGEIYNFADLRGELEGTHAFKSRSDAEVILHGFEEWGVEVLPRLRGMFAFAIWNERTRELFVARDRVGIKPLLIYRDADRLMFASEIKALLHAPTSDRTLDRRGLFDYLTYNYIPCPRTAYERIRKLPPAHYLIVNGDGSETLRSYWDLDLARCATSSEATARDLVRVAIDDAVRSHLVADVPLGVFLSGGVDSSTIATSMAEQRVRPIRTFSVGFDVASHNELEYASEVARYVRSEHSERVLTWPDAELELDALSGIYDEPFADPSSIPTIAVSRLARERVTVSLSGEGGDEAFAGYDTYSIWAQGQRVSEGVPNWARPFATFIGRNWRFARGQGFARLLRNQGVSPLEQYARLMEWITPEEKRRIVPQETLRELEDHDDRWYLRAHWRGDVDPITRLQYLDLRTYLPDDLLVKMDRASMSVSLEARVPLLDHLLLETAFSIPASIRFKDGRTKYIQRRALENRLPPVTLTRKKMGFTPPLAAWVTGKAVDWARSYLREGAAVQLGLIRADALEQLSPAPQWLWASKVWVLLVLESWARREAGLESSGTLQCVN